MNLAKSSGLFIDYLNFGYDKKKLSHFRYLTLPRNKVVAIVGKNGCGKTCFVKNLTGVEKAKALVIRGVNTKQKEQLKNSFIVMQDVNRQLYEESVIEELLNLTPQTDEDIIKAKRILSIFNLDEYLQEPSATLSEGQKQCLAFATALFLKKEIVVFDEPTAGLDYKNMIKFAKAIINIKNIAPITLLITNDAELLEYCADIIIEMDNAEIYKCYEKSTRN